EDQARERHACEEVELAHLGVPFSFSAPPASWSRVPGRAGFCVGCQCRAAGHGLPSTPRGREGRSLVVVLSRMTADLTRRSESVSYPRTARGRAGLGPGGGRPA